MLVTTRECPARRVPSGEHTSIPEGQFVTINQALGGNYTVTWMGNMLRIDGTDADALGLKQDTFSFTNQGHEGILEEQVWQALDSIYDPEIPISIVSLGLVYQVEIDQASQKVSVKMTLTAPGCGMGPVLVSDVKYRVKKVPNVEDVTVDLVFDPPWSKDMMSEEAQLEAGLFF
ncbi:putative Fe-S cluster assembly protein SufT [Alteromonas sp. a30]|uniref:putative Fe-S cluster assembly protein SufT n=1 Tax=Alteromonas sp. a30 TaxID=2730917 RepID=UPI00227DE5BC|nr:putative Fe-S cluster assembly protein SufT [Alteromonas sp. a30]MCY7296406.1 putative Fe-S cluster assembly protein SufT [Alteromonas sp. a30]